MKLQHVVDVEVDGIDRRDAPDFCDAFVARAAYPRFGGLSFLLERLTRRLPWKVRRRLRLGSILFRDLTEGELDLLNDNPDFVYDAVVRHLY